MLASAVVIRASSGIFGVNNAYNLTLTFISRKDFQTHVLVNVFARLILALGPHISQPQSRYFLVLIC